MDSTISPSKTYAIWRYLVVNQSRLLFVGLVLFTGILVYHLGAYAGGSDSSGYMNCAKLLSQGSTIVPQRAVPGYPSSDLAPNEPYAYVPLGFIPKPGGTQTPTYPTGLPLLIAGISSLVGWTMGPTLTIGLHSVLGLVVFYKLARHFGLPRGWAGFGAMILGLSPVYFMFAIQMMSDVPALVWVSLSVLLAFKSRSNRRCAIWTGIAFGIAVLVRPTNALALLPILIAIGLDWKKLLLLAVGGLPAAAFFLCYNYVNYGNALTTGYGSAFGLMSVQHLSASLLSYIQCLPMIFTPVIFLGLGMPIWCRKVASPKNGLYVLTCWAFCFLVFYAFYYHTHEVWWYLRFLLPGAPAIIIAALIVAHHLLQRSQIKLFSLEARPVQVAASLACVALCFGYFVFIWGQLHVLSSPKNERQYAEASDWVERNLPANAVITTMQSSGAVYYYTHFPVIRWDAINQESYDKIIQKCRAQSLPVYTIVFPFEQDEVKHGKAAGNWTSVQKIRNIEVWKLE